MQSWCLLDLIPGTESQVRKPRGQLPILTTSSSQQLRFQADDNSNLTKPTWQGHYILSHILYMQQQDLCTWRDPDPSNSPVPSFQDECAPAPTESRTTISFPTGTDLSLRQTLLKEREHDKEMFSRHPNMAAASLSIYGRR